MPKKSGFYYDISNADYHAGDELSSTGLKTFIQSPKLYEHEYLLGHKKKTNAALEFGSALHSYILERTKFTDTYVIESELPVINKRTKQGKLELELLQKELNGKIILSDDDYHKIIEINLNLEEEGKFPGFLERSKKEVSAYWLESVDGESIPCRARYDMVTDDGIILDIKSTQDPSFDEFSKSILNYSYYISAAFYGRSYESITGNKIKGFIFVACGTKPPYEVYLYQLDEYCIDLGNRIIDKFLPSYVLANRTKVYEKKKYPTMISIPEWSVKKIEQDLL